MNKLLILAAAILLLSGCISQPKTLYNWDKYTENAYKYIKNNTDTDTQNLIQTYKKMIDNPGGERQVPPPGICADYGYILVKQGKTQEGIAYLKKEIALYPESSIFIERIIKQLEQ